MRKLGEKTATEIHLTEAALGKVVRKMKKWNNGLFDNDEEIPHKPFVYIRWTDACSDAHGWKDEDAAIEWANGVQWLVETAGWIIKETREYLLIAQQRGDWAGADDYQYANFMKIPKTWIKLRIDLTKHI